MGHDENRLKKLVEVANLGHEVHGSIRHMHRFLWNVELGDVNISFPWYCNTT